MKTIITECFATIQGEYPAGVPSFFVRLGGCNLQCGWCDSTFASYKVNESQQSYIGDPSGAVNFVAKSFNSFKKAHPKSNISNFTITGGEPLLPKNSLFLEELFIAVKALGVSIAFETNGTQDPQYAYKLANRIGVTVRFVVSPKLKSSNQLTGASDSMRREIPHSSWESIASLVRFKFVVSRDTFTGDVEEIDRFRARFSDLSNIQPFLIMPEGIKFDGEWYKSIAEFCFKNGFDFCPRVHTILWGNERRR